ncbi:putative periplasmic protein [Gloeocapsa sp. PCC 73106]|nr:putative periplasmic protein [Gloeocapsa sp. PCC 73106]
MQTFWSWLAVGISFSLITTTVPVKSADQLDSDATQILQSMASYLTQTKTFSVNADIDFEVVAHNGQKLTLSSFATIILQRPNKFHIQRKGPIAEAEFFFDGETMTIHSKRNNVYTQLDVSGTIDDAIRAFELDTGIPAPGADLLFSDLYTVLSSGIQSSTYLGTAYVNGIECHHLAFREAEFDWQLWVQVGDRPFPMKYIITSKWLTGAPQYTMTLRNWDTNPKLNDEWFIFVAPEGATYLETLPSNELDEFKSTEGEQ